MRSLREMQLDLTEDYLRFGIEMSLEVTTYNMIYKKLQ
jgi:hypothetical protein